MSQSHLVSQMRFRLTNSPLHYRCQEWILRSGNFSLFDLQQSQLRNKFLCALHFTDNSFMNELKTKLVFNSVPNPEPLEEPADVENEDNSRQHSDYEMHQQGSCSPPAREPVHSSPDTSLPTDLTPRKRKLTQRINEQKLKLPKQRKKLWRMRHLATKKPDVKAVATEAVKHMSPKCGTLFGMQLLHKPFTPWTEAERRLSLSLFYKSPAAYDHLRRKVGMKLPSKKVIQKWVSEMDIIAGTETKLFEHLVEKVKTMDDSCRDCVLVFDEMSVRKCLSYCAKYDVVEGYEDFGSLGQVMTYNESRSMLSCRQRRPYLLLRSASNDEWDTIPMVHEFERAVVV
ncbi:uncharacterized protein LOC126160762 [Schistocerca cancellata]|uniref:uncharacterized protein LOC126160762 n=1 Tax=Schistocerca cancellata TaxID=274614 RepID=UPI002119886D|nr:uncharacterized protein LOC126160762 [Schistocerca cancellata]